MGPYLPMILEACQEDEYAYEYRHGVTSYGAFTYSLTNILRSHETITFKRLIERANSRLIDLGYDQQSQILGPSSLVKARVPWKLK